MAHHRNTPQPHGGGMIMGGGGDSSGFSYVGGEQLKQVDTPVETLIGVANGAASGAIASAVVSAAVTLGKEGTAHGAGQKIFRNIFSAHLVHVLAGTAAFAALGGLIRNSRARKHNEWSDKHYDFLAQQTENTHAERIENEKAGDADKGARR